MTDEQAERMISVLTEIRNGIAFLISPQAEPVCDHPAEARLDLSSMGEVEWQCCVCGFHYEETT